MRARRIGLLFCLLLTTASVLAAQQSSSSVRSHDSAKQKDPDSSANGVYRNSTFGFAYKIPFGWVDRTADLNEDAGDGSSSQVLLAIFERPPDATGSTINSSVLIAVEPASNYPGIRNPEDYFGPLNEVAKSHGFTVVNQAYEFRAGTKQLVRGDFIKPLASLTAYQSSLVMMQNHAVISFTFVAGSEDEVDQLIESLSFVKVATGPR